MRCYEKQWEANMEDQELVVERMRARYLSACWQMLGSCNTRCMSEQDTATLKQVFELVKSGNFQQAAELAKTNEYAQEVWALATK